ncbi:AsnC family transcriptional regulator [Streptomyces longispororuber]|uniref:AsnC family transcriptional regulator n=1 Tax=Streptomyces longispororuber TaxID=68230 RepID=A0A919ABS9_9ACTN|nr:Lrp/AsnC family transcriptional regulator [Streptomyces longispororuber]GHE97585.1 AsnC family transcriptional regulator [Streptomyces longispororuber]
MAGETSEDVLDERDQRLVAALQCDGRLAADRAAEVLGLSPRVVHRRWAALLGDGTVRVVGLPAQPVPPAGMTLRIKVLRGRTEMIAKALAEREDVPFVDLSAGGDEISAILLADTAAPHRLLHRQLPATNAVTSVDAQTVLHVFKGAQDWRHDVLTAAERGALTPDFADPGAQADRGDATDRALLAALAEDGRAPAAAVARATGHPESTVRRRLADLRACGLLRTHVHVDARRLGLPVDANLLMRVAPGRLDAVGRTLAAHPAVHGALATTGRANLHVAVWLPDLPALYAFLTREVGALDVAAVETLLVGRAVKRPGA